MRRDPHLIYACFCLNGSLTGSGVANHSRTAPAICCSCYTCSLWEKQDFNTNYSEIKWKVCGQNKKKFLTNFKQIVTVMILYTSGTTIYIHTRILYVCVYPLCLRVSGRCLCIQMHFSMRPSLIANLNCNWMLFVPRDFCISQNCLRLFESSKYVDGNTLGYILYTVCVCIENNCLNAVEGGFHFDSYIS